MWLGTLTGQSQVQLGGFKSRMLRAKALGQRHLYVTEWWTTGGGGVCWWCSNTTSR